MCVAGQGTGLTHRTLLRAETYSRFCRKGSHSHALLTLAAFLSSLNWVRLPSPGANLSSSEQSMPTAAILTHEPSEISSCM